MFKPLRLSTGEVVRPIPVYEGTIVGDALGISRPGDPDFDLWLGDSVKATPAQEKKLRRELADELKPSAP